MARVKPPVGIKPTSVIQKLGLKLNGTRQCPACLTPTLPLYCREGGGRAQCARCWHREEQGEAPAPRKEKETQVKPTSTWEPLPLETPEPEPVVVPIEKTNLELGNADGQGTITAIHEGPGEDEVTLEVTPDSSLTFQDQEGDAVTVNFKNGKVTDLEQVEEPPAPVDDPELLLVWYRNRGGRVNHRAWVPRGRLQFITRRGREELTAQCGQIGEAILDVSAEVDEAAEEKPGKCCPKCWQAKVKEDQDEADSKAAKPLDQLTPIQEGPAKGLYLVRRGLKWNLAHLVRDDGSQICDSSRKRDTWVEAPEDMAMCQRCQLGLGKMEKEQAKAEETADLDAAAEALKQMRVKGKKTRQQVYDEKRDRAIHRIEKAGWDWKKELGPKPTYSDLASLALKAEKDPHPVEAVSEEDPATCQGCGGDGGAYDIDSQNHVVVVDCPDCQGKGHHGTTQKPLPVDARPGLKKPEGQPILGTLVGNELWLKNWAVEQGLGPTQIAAMLTVDRAPCPECDMDLEVPKRGQFQGRPECPEHGRFTPEQRVSKQTVDTWLKNNLEVEKKAGHGQKAQMARKEKELELSGGRALLPPGGEGAGIVQAQIETEIKGDSPPGKSAAAHTPVATPKTLSSVHPPAPAGRSPGDGYHGMESGGDPHPCQYCGTIPKPEDLELDPDTCPGCGVVRADSQDQEDQGPGEPPEQDPELSLCSGCGWPAVKEEPAAAEPAVSPPVKVKPKNGTGRPMGVVRPMMMEELLNGHQVGFLHPGGGKMGDHSLGAYGTGRIQKLTTRKGKLVEVSIKPTVGDRNIRVPVEKLVHRIFRRNYYPIDRSPAAWPRLEGASGAQGWKRATA